MNRLGVVLVGVLALGACGEASEGERSPDASPQTSSPTASAEPSPSNPNPSNPGAAMPGETVLTGTAVRDDELRCWTLTDATGAGYTLIGNIGGLISGARVSVAGRVDPGATTTCQTGRVFVVTGVATG